MGQNFFNIIIVNRHEFLGFHQGFVYIPDYIPESLQGAVLLGNNFLPVPLVYINRVDIVGFLIPADGVHVGINPLPHLKTVFFQSVTFPLCKGVYNFGRSLVLLTDGKGDRALHTV